MNNIQNESINPERKIVDMSLDEKILEFFEPLLGNKLQRLPIFSGIAHALYYGLSSAITTGFILGGSAYFDPLVCVGTGIAAALISFVFDVRHFSGKRSNENIKKYINE